MTLRLLLIRHGRVQWSSRQFLQTARGLQWDPPLDEVGTEQAELLGARLLMMDPPEAVYTSPFTRCRDTAAPYLTATGRSAEVVDDLGEVFVGDWEGVSFEEIVSQDEELAKRFREQEAMFSIAPGGESGASLRARVVPALEGVIRRHASGTVLLIVHGGVINAYLGHVMGIPHDMFFLPENTSINTIEAEGDRREMRFINDVRHLTEPNLFRAQTA
jgi:probable phosphoglycerate mutase